MERYHLKSQLHWKTLYEGQTGSRCSKFVKQNMEKENVLQLTINSEKPPITINSDLENWSFNSYSHGYKECMNICVSLIRDETQICGEKKNICMIFILCPLFKETLSLEKSSKIYVPSFGNFYLYLIHQ